MRFPGREILLAVLGGAFWGWALGKDPPAGLALIALAPLFLLLDHPRAPRLAWLHGLVTWLVAIPWIVPTLVTFGALPKVVAWLLFLLLCGLILAPTHLLFAFLGRRLWHAGSWTALLALPSLWVVIEAGRAYFPGFLAFPWNLAAYSWIDIPGALPLASWVGAFGVSWCVVLVNTGAALAWRTRRWEVVTATGLVAATILALGARWGAGPEPTGVPVEVSIVQPNHVLLPDDGSVVWAQYQALIETSREECARGSRERLLIWPESAGWPLSWDRDARLRRDLEDLAMRGCSVLLNSTLIAGSASAGSADWSNSALLVTAEGSEQRYAKRRLVPFGETVPMADLFPFIGRLARHAGSFTAGEDPGLIAWSGEQIGVAICYESIFPQDTAEQIRAGATLLTTLSNDAWYGDSSAPYQLLRAARFRAAESRRPMARAGLTGVSALIASDGSIIQQLPLGERGVLRGRLRGSDRPSPYAQKPWAVPLGALLMFFVGIYFSRSSALPSGSPPDPHLTLRRR